MRRLRHRIGRAARRLLGRADPIILMYHRVADASVDPWALAVSPANFAAQMRLLAKTRRPVPLDWLAGELLAGRTPAGAVAITFDDAYRDVLRTAKPILDELDIPATVFVVTGALGCEQGFWWDRLASIIFRAPELPAEIALSFVEPGDRSAIAEAAGSRESLHLKLWSLVRLLGPSQREAAVTETAEALGTSAPLDAPVMTSAEVKELTANGRVTVGAHSVSHPSLPSLSWHEQRAEMLGSRGFLEDLIGEPVRRFAYPFGDFDERSEAIARALGFDYAVSVRAGAANDKREIFRLPRLDVKNWSGAEFGQRLKWFS